jgi:hypothetical protein
MSPPQLPLHGMISHFATLLLPNIVSDNKQKPELRTHSQILRMSVKGFDSLPVELLYHICRYINQTHKPTLRSLVLVDKLLHSIAASLLFHTVRIYHDELDKDQLAKNVLALPHTVAWQIRHLIIEPVFLRGDKPSSLDSMRVRYERASAAGQSPLIFQSIDVEDAVWSPLAELITDTLVLSDLTYNCPRQFPPSLLAALHSKQPKCKLRINLFNMNRLSKSQYDKNAAALATSPCLYGLGAYYSSYVPDFSGMDSESACNGTALMDLVTGVAPNIKEIGLFNTFFTRHRTTRETWYGAALGEIRRKRQARPRAAIEFLSLDEPVTHDCSFIAWRQCIDTLTLRTLDLKHAIDVVTLEYLVTDCEFSSLKNLDISIRARRVAGNEDARYESACNSFFASLPPLTSLKITGDVTPIIWNTLWERQGKELENFNLDQFGHNIEQVILRSNEIQTMVDSCPQLSELALKIPRSRGDTDEVAIYKALGSIPNLYNLDLKLDTAMYSNDVESYCGRGIQSSWAIPKQRDYAIGRSYTRLLSAFPGVRRRYIEDTFINSAVDDTLARSIFRAVSSGKPPGSIPLESLTLIPTGAFQFKDTFMQYPESFTQLGARVRRSWRVERNPRDDSRDELITTCLSEIQKQQDQQLQQDVPQHLFEQPRRGYPDGFERKAEKIFNGLWPGNKGQNEVSKDWLDGWHSFPLQGV